MDRIGTLAECEDLISCYEDFIKESRPHLVEKLKGLGACPVFHPLCERHCVGSTFVN